MGQISWGVCPFQAFPTYCLQLRSEHNQVKLLKSASLQVRLLALSTNVTLGWKSLLGTHTLAYVGVPLCCPFVSDKEKKFLNTAQDSNPIAIKQLRTTDTYANCTSHQSGPLCVLRADFITIYKFVILIFTSLQVSTYRLKLT